MARLLPIVLIVVALVAGAGAGIVLHPASESAATEGAGDESHIAADDEPGGHGTPPPRAPAAGGGHGDAAGAGDLDYVRLDNQFIVPVVGPERIESLVILSLSLEVTSGSREQVFAREPRLRDALLRVLFDHAHAGGFGGEFTAPTRLDALRRALNEAAGGVLGPILRDVLILDLVRQDA